MFKLDFEKAEEPEIKLPKSVESQKKQENSRKTSTSALFTIPKPLTLWITTNCGKFLKREEYQTTSPASWETCMQVKKQQLKPDTVQRIGSKLVKEYIKAVYCRPVYITYIQSTSWNARLDETEAADIKKKWQEYTEELYKKYFHDPDNHNGVITHLEPDILECELK